MAEKLSFLNELNAKLAKDGLWLSLEVLRVRVNAEYLHYYDLEALVDIEELEEPEDEVARLRLRKGPSIRDWRYEWDIW